MRERDAFPKRFSRRARARFSRAGSASSQCASSVLVSASSAPALMIRLV